ncbi:hypothetical protein COT64_02010 [Candidatus Shapirobacteria bacterium CG09_land_8_20_14_0_10_39_12]|uniref:DUF5659 domain-containing protein n=1 Tax=Candidatus Shapirobacteria bacterium CG09_land_8_20_14_0_10_39_12 TaxID=1974885 RepID=A0A2H0WRM2_9BACT|nr:MAG: hypothetical protein COT64_02010 [Candidatus Shapirobacteria bacterium CG09_land_8_20_14_0_10_39_12]
MTNLLNKDQHWATYDLGCSAALVTEGFELVSLERDNPKKVKFIFLQSKNLEKCVNDYFAGRLLVSARSLFDNTKMLKNRIYSTA